MVIKDSTDRCEGPYAATTRCGKSATPLRWSQPRDPWFNSCTFFAVHLKWSKNCIIQLARSNCSHVLAGSPLVVALKLSNIKDGCEAPGMFNYNLDIICAVQLKCHMSNISQFWWNCTKWWLEFPKSPSNSAGNLVQHFISLCKMSRHFHHNGTLF